MHIKLILKTLNFVFALLLILAACAFAYIALPSFGNRALIVRSGSMQPTVGVGDLVVVRAKGDIASPVKSTIPKYKVGEIVAFKSGESIVTHRIADVKVESGKVLYVTKGDANKTADNVPVLEENVIGGQFLQLPKVGKIVSFTKGNIGFPLMIVVPALLVIFFEVLAIYREVKKQKNVFLLTPQGGGIEKSAAGLPKEFSLRSNDKLLSLKVLLPIFMTIFVFQSTFAYFSDTETSTNNIFTASSSFGSPSPTPSPSPSPSPSPTPPPIAQTLVMNEVLPLSSENQGNDNCQFLELWNGSGATVSLQNFKLTDGVIATPIAIVNSNTDLPNGQFAILVKSNGLIQQCDALASMPNGTITANFGGQVDLNTGTLQLLDANDNVIDTVLWGSSPNPTPAIDESIEREPDGTDSQTGTGFEPTDFVVRTTPQPGQ